jgi:hypothetical protein
MDYVTTNPSTDPSSPYYYVAIPGHELSDTLPPCPPWPNKRQCTVQLLPVVGTQQQSSSESAAVDAANLTEVTAWTKKSKKARAIIGCTVRLESSTFQLGFPTLRGEP